jgi:hypothetical protein
MDFYQVTEILNNESQKTKLNGLAKEFESFASKEYEVLKKQNLSEKDFYVKLMTSTFKEAIRVSFADAFLLKYVDSLEGEIPSREEFEKRLKDK